MREQNLQNISYWNKSLAYAFQSDDLNQITKIIHYIANSSHGNFTLYKDDKIIYSYPDANINESFALIDNIPVSIYNMKIGEIKIGYSWNLLLQQVVQSAILWIGILLLFILYIIYQNAIRKIEIVIFKSQLALQVAHDIRSPLAALSGVIKNLKLRENDPNKKILQSVIARIEGIANDLLDTNKQLKRVGNINNLQISKTKPHDPVKLVQEVISEKQIQFQANYELEIILENKITSSLTVDIDATHFSRLVSNLINNSAEAINYQGKIKLMISLKQNNFQLVISDQGPGIPKHILDNIDQGGITTKSHGNGLGLVHAKKSIEQWQGNFDITSSPSGTTITISLPAKIISTPFPSHSTTNQAAPIILLDDDELVHLNWQVKAEKSAINLYCFTNPKQLLDALTDFPKNSIFYIDSSLGEGIKGEDIARQIYNQGFENIYMASGYEAEHFAHLKFLKGVVGKQAPF